MIWLILAITTLLLGHLVKVHRWWLLIELYEKPAINVLLKSLSVAHAINFVIPFHLGDLYRIWYSGKRMVNGVKFSLATIIVEHYIDLIVLAVICVVLFIMGHNTIGTMVLVTSLTTTVVILTLVTMRWDNRTKYFVVKFAEIFNSQIELWILGGVWTFVSIFKCLISEMSKLKIVTSTFLMWALYLVSYWSMAESFQSTGLNLRMRDVLDILFNRSSIINGETSPMMASYLSIYVLLPLVVIYIASYLYQRKHKSTDENFSVSIIPHVKSDDALTFLETFFKGNQGGAYMKGFLEVNKDVSILQDYSAGSNAVTLLCTDGNRTFFRKFAIGTDGEKLYQQIEWLRTHGQNVPLPKILSVKKESTYCSYDMEYNEGTQNFFTYIHTHTSAQSWEILKRALDTLKEKQYTFDKIAPNDIVEKYITEKVVKNLQKIRSSAMLSEILQYDDIYVNGVKYKNLNQLEKCLEASNLKSIFSNSPICDIHGDLTIENIICNQDSYYLIDPNTANVLESPYLDLGKIFQSLHGGYEFLMRIPSVVVRGNKIDFTFIRSSAYDSLYSHLCKYIMSTYGKDVLRQAYYHEVVHWLRLLPYKLNNLGAKSLIFYAGLIIVLNDVERNSKAS